LFTCSLVLTDFGSLCFRYLLRLGLKRAKLLLASGADTDLLEKIISLLVQDSPLPWKLQPVEKVESAADTDAAAEGGSGTKVDKTDEDLLSDLKLRSKWLKAIAEFDRFDLTKRFLSASLLSAVVSLLSQQSDTDMTATIDKYSP
jgi:hypothetical protein